MSVISSEQKKRLTEALKQCICMKDDDSRQAVVKSIDHRDIPGNIRIGSSLNVDANRIVEVCASYDRGIDCLMGAIEHFEGLSHPFKVLRKEWEKVKQENQSVPEAESLKTVTEPVVSFPAGRLHTPAWVIEQAEQAEQVVKKEKSSLGSCLSLIAIALGFVILLSLCTTPDKTTPTGYFQTRQALHSQDVSLDTRIAAFQYQKQAVRHTIVALDLTMTPALLTATQEAELKAIQTPAPR